jgi:hypothetical protein
MGFVKRHKVLCVVVGVVVVLVAAALILVLGVFRPFDVKPVAEVGGVENAPKCTSIPLSSINDSSICLEDVKNSLARQVLSDGDVTAEEYQEVLDTYVSCLSAEGITATDVTPGGGGTYAYASKAVAGKDANNALINKCSASTGFSDVGQKYNQEVVNPDNLDGEEWEAAWIACFVRIGLEPEGFTVADYNQFTMEDSQELAAKPRYMDCMLDPLHTQP